MAILCYIVSTSLQLAGALMLIVFAFSTKRENVIRAFARSHMITLDGNTRELSYNHKAFIETYKTAYYTKISVIFISVGYLLGIFGNIGTAIRWRIALIVACVTGVLIVITNLTVRKLVDREKVNKTITSAELEMVGAVPDVEIAGSEDIERVLFS